MKFLKIINTIFGLLLLVSFFGVFISLFALPHFKIGDHNFNTPVVLFFFVLLGAFVVFLLKPILKEGSGLKTRYSSGAGYWVILGLHLIFITIVGYFAFYLPLQSIYLGEFNFQNTNSIKINAEKGMLIFFEIDAGADTRDGTQIQINLSGDSFNSTSNAVIGKRTNSERINKERTNKSTNNIIFMKEAVPYEGEYTVTVEKKSGNTPLSNIRVYGTTAQN